VTPSEIEPATFRFVAQKTELPRVASKSVVYRFDLEVLHFQNVIQSEVRRKWNAQKNGVCPSLHPLTPYSNSVNFYKNLQFRIASELGENMYKMQTKFPLHFFVEIIRTINTLSPELNSICYLLALLLLAHHFVHVNRIRVKSLNVR
jgi:hypothetical protein